MEHFCVSTVTNMTKVWKFEDAADKLNVV